MNWQSQYSRGRDGARRICLNCERLCCANTSEIRNLKILNPGESFSGMALKAMSSISRLILPLLRPARPILNLAGLLLLPLSAFYEGSSNEGSKFTCNGPPPSPVCSFRPGHAMGRSLKAWPSYISCLYTSERELLFPPQA